MKKKWRKNHCTHVRFVEQFNSAPTFSVCTVALTLPIAESPGSRSPTLALNDGHGTASVGVAPKHASRHQHRPARV
jgi:hypothetical protein